MKTSALLLLVSFILTTHIHAATLLRGNFWPNPTFEEGENLDDPAGTPAGWQRGGSAPAFCQVLRAGENNNHALAVVDEDNRYAEWYADVPISGKVVPGDKIDLRWSELFSISGSEMRVTVIFFSSGMQPVGVGHFVTRSQSEGWTGDLETSTFTERNETMDVPDGAAILRVSLVSGGTLETQGTMLIDDLSVARHPAPILLPDNIWTNSPTFEDGTNLDQPTGTPLNWKRGGSDTSLLQVSQAASISPTHALAVIDNNDEYGEWYSDLPLSGKARAGDSLNLQWFEMFSIAAGGRMWVNVALFTSSGAAVDVKHYMVREQSSGWTGSAVDSPFTQRQESILVPEGAATMRVSVVSDLETTGILLIDDFSVNIAAPPLPEVLVGNIWRNPGFEIGENLENSTGATVAGWERGGTDMTFAILSSERSVSASHALGLSDTSTENSGEWTSDFDLGASTAPGRTLDVQWFELFNVSAGEMQLEFAFANAENQSVGQTTFAMTGTNRGWKGSVAASDFNRRNEKVVVPEGARKMTVTFRSSATATGTALIDNLSLAPEPNQPVVLFGNIWTNSGFEEGTELDNPTVGVPTGWQRGGADVSIPRVVGSAYMSTTHALAVVDDKADTYGEWYQFFDLAGKVVAGDKLEAQWWEIFNVNNGEMRVSVYFRNEANTTLQENHFVARGQSAGWSNQGVPFSYFTRRNETLTVPAGSVKMLVTLTSGGPAETTGMMVIDDLSFAKPPPPPDLLTGNFWPNPTFELGTQLDKPTLGVLEGGWRRGGNHVQGDQITTLRATSPTHALAVVDDKTDAYSEWYVQVPIAGLFAGGDTLDVQWYQLFDTTGGDMRVSFYFRGQDEGVLSQRHFTVNGQPEGWNEDLASTPFVKRIEQLEVPEETVFMFVTVASGGSAEVTGTLIIDDLSMRVAPGAPQIVSINKTAEGIALKWQGKIGKFYTVESSDTLASDSWTAVPELESIPATSAETEAVDTRPTTTAARFYRIVEQP